MSTEPIIVYFDGLCEPVNPGGVAAYGFVVYKGNEKIYEEGEVIGAGFWGDDVSNNVAEYTALIKALEWLLENGYTEKVIVKGDSQLVIRQVTGRYAVRAKRITPLYQRVMELIEGFKDISFEWVSREENEEADKLSRKAFEKFVKENLEEYVKHYGKYLLTERQRELIEKLGGKVEPWMSKRKASELIDHLMRSKR